VLQSTFEPHWFHTGPWLLSSAGVLRGRTATCFVAIKDDVINAGATYIDAEVGCQLLNCNRFAMWFDTQVVVDGNLITSRIPSDLPVFCKTIIRALTATA
jgi:protease I